MFSKLVSSLYALGLILLMSTAVRAQQIPSPAQAQQMLKSDPSLIGRLQQMMQSSGLTPDQVRDRLKQAGYPDSLLDAYLPGGRADSTSMPSADVFSAVRALGLGDSTFVDSLSRTARSQGRNRARSDSAFLDTLSRAMKNDSTADAVRVLLRSRDLQRRQLDSGFKVFGLDLFGADASGGMSSGAAANRFDATSAGGADANYRFGPGDKLVLFLTGDVEKSYNLNVTREGFVVIPDVGTVNVSGLTRSQLEDLLYSRLGRVYSGVRRGAGATTRFYIDVSQMGTNQIFVNGDVNHPGSYRMSRSGTAMTALYLAGGPTASGSMRNILIRRNGQTAATFDVYDYALHGDATNDIRLENGDIVFVLPRGPQVRVAGAVLRPATYEIKPTQTVTDAITMAGGFKSEADRRRVQVVRVVPPNERTTSGSDRKVVDVPSDLFDSAPVRGGDVVLITEVAARVANRVNIRGNVWSPGAIGYTPGMTLYDALRRSGGLKPDSYLGEVLVSRLRADSTRMMLRTPVRDTTGNPVENFALSDADEVMVFSTTDFRPRRYITVAGAVRIPGRVAYRDGMTMHDAVLIAGGLLEGASLTDAEIASLPENRAAGVTAMARTVPLDSTYLFERGPNGAFGGPPGLVVPTARAPEVILQPYDAVLIKRQPEFQLQQTVSVQGEVKYPGDYSLVTKTERLSDVLKRAGNLTASAYPGGIVFIRKRNDIGRIGLDLPSVLRDDHNIDNVQLVDGDSVFIPRYTQVVVVRGAVHSQVGVAFANGANLDYYIRSAGGATSKGDQGRAYVTQPNGKVDARHREFLFWTAEPQPQPGSTVIVPEKDPTDKRDWLAIATASTSILGSLIAVAAILRR